MLAHVRVMLVREEKAVHIAGATPSAQDTYYHCGGRRWSIWSGGVCRKRRRGEGEIRDVLKSIEYTESERERESSGRRCDG